MLILILAIILLALILLQNGVLLYTGGNEPPSVDKLQIAQTLSNFVKVGTPVAVPDQYVQLATDLGYTVTPDAPVRIKIGDGADPNTIYVGHSQPTHRIYGTTVRTSLEPIETQTITPKQLDLRTQYESAQKIRAISCSKSCP